MMVKKKKNKEGEISWLSLDLESQKKMIKKAKSGKS